MSSNVVSCTDVAEVQLRPRDRLMGGTSWTAIGFAVAEAGPVQGSELSLSAFRLEFQVR